MDGTRLLFPTWWLKFSAEVLQGHERFASRHLREHSRLRSENTPNPTPPVVMIEIRQPLSHGYYHYFRHLHLPQGAFVQGASFWISPSSTCQKCWVATLGQGGGHRPPVLSSSHVHDYVDLRRLRCQPTPTSGGAVNRITCYNSSRIVNLL